MRTLILEEVKEEDRVHGEDYICEMKHGFIEGSWEPEYGTCVGYYWQDIEWFPYTTYKIKKEIIE